MITYIFKTIICSAIFIAMYYLLLEREKIYRFNRIYLLLSIALSFIIPLINVTVKTPLVIIPETIYQANTSFQNTVLQQTPPSVNTPSVNNNNTLTITSILLLGYLTVTAFLFCRFIINIFIIFNKIKTNSSVPFLDAKLVLTKEKHNPFSFLNYVFIHKEDFESGTIEKEILSHELAHIKQKHSIDILLIELLMIFAWINPFIYLYRKAIQLNHEFLADEFVVNNFSSTEGYQLLLLDKARQPYILLLSCSFNYLQTKKRIIMMSKKTSHRIAILKQIALIPVLVVTGFLFTTKIVAKDKTIPVQQQAISTQQQQKPNPLVVIDGVVSDKVGSDIPSSEIAHMDFFEGKAAIDKYGEKGKNGVIEIMTKKRAAELGIKISSKKNRDNPEDYPTFQGGSFGSFNDWVINQIKYPPEAIAKGVQGNVIVYYTVESDGTINNYKLMSAPDPLLGDVVVKTVLSSPKWEPAKNTAMFVRPVTWQVELKFQLPNKVTIPDAFTLVEVMPEFPGGDKAISQYISENLKYPTEAREQKIEGRVIVRFIINTEGKVEDAQILKSINPLLDAEAKRVLSSTSNWKPGYIEGKPVNVYFTMPVEFKLQ